MSQYDTKIDHVCEHYQQGIEYINKYFISSGDLQSATGNLYQNLAMHAIKLVEPRAKCLHNDYIKKWSKSRKYYNDKMQVDLHVYLDGELKFLLESKTYFDTSHIKRTVVDFNEIRSVVGHIPAIVWSGQNAMSKNSEGFYREECDFDYFVINQTKKRDGRAPVHSMYDPLDKNVIKDFMVRVEQILKGK